MEIEGKDVPEKGRGEGQLLVSEEATATGAVTISPTAMDGNAVTLMNDTEQVCKTVRRLIYTDDQYPMTGSIT